MTRSLSDGPYLEGQLLVAMPGMSDPRFARSVIYLFAHSASGAMGLVINKALDTITFAELLQQLNINPGPESEQIVLHFGGPVETGRGFVLHSADYVRDATMIIGKDMALTATVDVLKAIAAGQGPRRSLLALGYAGWAPGQLETEIQGNGWLHCAADPELIFGADIGGKYERALRKIGIDLAMLSNEAGHA